MTGPSIQKVLVVVPVHDEASLLARCLDSIRGAIEMTDAASDVRVVLDACTDASAEIAARYPFALRRLDANSVGVARAAGIADGLAHVDPLPSERVWIANTDADSAVPPNWLQIQLDLAASGSDVVIGTVRPDFRDLAPAHRRLWLATHTRGRPNGHTHGANLGVRASAYLAAGGFDAISEHEDVRLVEACRRVGATVTATDAAEVLTSGRMVGRTPGGYAGYLREQARTLAD